MGSTFVVSDLDGTLATADMWRGVLAWVRDRYPSAAARRFVGVRLPRVMLAKTGLVEKERFKAGWYRDMARLLAGLPEARLPELAAWVVDDWLWPARRAMAVAALERAMLEARSEDAGAQLVVATGAYQQIAEAFALRLGADLALGTPLEVADGQLTGRLAAPLQTGPEKARAVGATVGAGVLAAAFGDTGADIPMLRLARRAVAVAPDRDLRRAALREGWEILDGE